VKINVNILESALSDADLIKVLERHCGAKIIERFAEYKKRLSARRFIVPVTGVQGCGKSTLLNAMLFERAVLPIEVDETTCVPVEIIYSQTPSEKAIVEFRDERKESVIADRITLADYVDNANNPGNKKGVKRVILESDAQVLKNGLVLVDLPGVFSLTKANYETTLSYLSESIGILFLLRTIPPLTRSEAAFVANFWARLRTVFFVQNRWNDETDEEVNNALEYIKLTLMDIAKRSRIKLENPLDIYIVNAYEALKGRLSKDEGLIQKSGLQTFMEKLNLWARNWPEVVRSATLGGIASDIKDVYDDIVRQINELSTDREKIKENLRLEEKQFNKYMEELNKRYKQGIKILEDFQKETKTFINNWDQNARSDLRNAMRTKFRAGIVDGPRLERALRDEEGEKLNEIFSEIQEKILVLQDEIKERFKDLQPWKPRTFDPIHTISTPEKLKWEKLTSKISGPGIALVGAEIGASVGGPIGAFVGFIIGGFLGYWLGKKGEHKITNLRVKEVEPKVFKAIDNFVEHTCRDLNSQINEVVEYLGNVLNSWRDEQKSTYEKARVKTEENLKASFEERQAKIEKLKSELELLNTWLDKLEGAIK